MRVKSLFDSLGRANPLLKENKRPTQSIGKKTEGLLRIGTLVKSPCLKVNYDTGNAYIGGEDTYTGCGQF